MSQPSNTTAQVHPLPDLTFPETGSRQGHLAIFKMRQSAAPHSWDWALPCRQQRGRADLASHAMAAGRMSTISRTALRWTEALAGTWQSMGLCFGNNLPLPWTADPPKGFFSNL